VKVAHVGIAVKDLEEGIALWSGLFGLRLKMIEEIRERGLKVAVLEADEGPAVELIASLDEASEVARFLEQRGEGIHHLCLRVPDVRETMEKLKQRGVRFVHEEPGKGTEGSRVAFVHPRSAGGVLVELKEK